MSGGRFEFDDGGIYCGEWQDGKAHGYGICTGPKNVGKFEGFWQEGFEVLGVYIWPNGNRYEGEWKDGRRHGLGVETSGTETYCGEWKNGLRHGCGVLCDASGGRYEGTWSEGLQDGYGAELHSDGSKFYIIDFHT